MNRRTFNLLAASALAVSLGISGVPTDPCNGFEIPLPVQISTQLYVQVKLG